MKKIKIIVKKEDFEKFVNREDMEIIQIDVKGAEQNSFTQESFIAVIYYKLIK